MFSEVFFTGLYSWLIGLKLACHSIKIIRDVAGEEVLDQQQTQTPITPQNNL